MKQSNEFKTHVNVVLKASNQLSQHFKWNVCICLSSHNGCRTIVRCNSMGSKPTLTLFWKPQSQCWSISVRLNIFMWIHPIDYTPAVRSKTIDSRLVWLQVSKLSSHGRSMTMSICDFPYGYRTNVRSSSMASRHMWMLFLMLLDQCRSIPKCITVHVWALPKGFRAIAWGVPMSSGPMWVMFLKLQCNYRSSSDGTYVYDWIPLIGNRTIVQCNSTDSKQLCRLFLKLQGQCWSIPIGLSVTCRLPQWLHTHWTKQFNGLKSCVNTNLKLSNNCRSMQDGVNVNLWATLMAT